MIAAGCRRQPRFLDIWCILPVLTLTSVDLMTLTVGQLLPPPRFSHLNSNVVLAQVGETAALHCRVEGLRAYSVSWIRQSDLQILSVGVNKFTSDARIDVYHDPRTSDFSLVISRLRRGDEGLYECHINSNPINIFTVRLTLTDIPKHEKEESPGELVKFRGKQQPPDSQEPVSGSSTEIHGGPDIYVFPGSLVNLTCVVTSSSQPGKIFWYHQGKVISYYSRRRGVSIKNSVAEDMVTVSNLILRNASVEDEGTYICRPEKKKKSAEARLFIIHDSRSEATRTSSSSPSSPLSTMLLLHILLVLHLLLRVVV